MGADEVVGAEDDVGSTAAPAAVIELAAPPLSATAGAILLRRGNGWTLPAGRRHDDGRQHSDRNRHHHPHWPLPLRLRWPGRRRHGRTQAPGAGPRAARCRSVSTALNMSPTSSGDWSSSCCPTWRWRQRRLSWRSHWSRGETKPPEDRPRSSGCGSSREGRRSPRSRPGGLRRDWSSAPWRADEEAEGL